MSVITITITDGDNDSYDAKVDFDPDLTTIGALTPAGIAALSAFSFLCDAKAVEERFATKLAEFSEARGTQHDT